MIIGVVGGMGSYATLNFFERYLSVFPAEKEWQRPRIIIDNRCSMPSRVRAILYDEQWNVVVDEITDSINLLLNAGCDRIVLACNTSHVFLDDVYSRIPEARGAVVHIIDTLGSYLSSNDELKVRDYSLIATEGTILSGIYQYFFGKYALRVSVPKEEEFEQMRFYIEAVKTNYYSKETLASFVDFLGAQSTNNLILGCTEFPVIVQKAKQILGDECLAAYNIFDPLEATLAALHNEFLLSDVI